MEDASGLTSTGSGALVLARIMSMSPSAACVLTDSRRVTLISTILDRQETAREKPEPLTVLRNQEEGGCP